MHYLLFYEVGEDYVVRRAQFRDAHLEKAEEASARGDLVLGGALADPVDGAVLLFTGDSPAVAENFAKADPYVIHGAVKRWYVRQWTTVAGEGAAVPVRPQTAIKSQSAEQVPILRMWKARSTEQKAGLYIQHATNKVFPALRRINGHRGAYLLRRAIDGGVEIVVLTLWESIEAVRRFAGAKPDKAVVEAEARAVLVDFDDSVTHFEVVKGPDRS